MRRRRAAGTGIRRLVVAAWVAGALRVGYVFGQPQLGDPPPATSLPAAVSPVSRYATATAVQPPGAHTPALTPVAPVVVDPTTPAPLVVMPSVTVGTAPAPTSNVVADPTANPGVACDPCAFLWLKVPVVTPMPRLGDFIISPAGPGYYSLADLLSGTNRDAAPRMPFGNASLYATSAFDYDFRYLDDPNNGQMDWSDCYKRIHPNDNWLLSTGGEFRFRYVDETYSRGLNVNNDYYLLRSRVYGDVWYKDQYRLFVEGIYSQTFDQNQRQLPIDATGADLLNAFVEAKVGCILDNPLYIRAGRQELLYGAQRLISTIDWANTRRTYQGVKAYWHSSEFDVDAFWVEPVVPNADRFDSVDSNRNFFGLWTTYRPQSGTFFDLYYLGLTTSGGSINGDVQTVGGRYAGDICKRWLFDAEGAAQYGDREGRHVFAQMATGGLGYRFADLPWNAQFWAYYDYASGDKDPASTSYRTFNQLFPFGHYYLGYLDLVGRQNIRDLNFQFSYNPQPWITSVAQVHIFKLDARKDALYNAAGVAIRRDPTGLAGDDVGQEIDFTTNFHLSPHQDLLLGYSKFFGGDFWRATGPAGNPELFYAQYTLRW